MGTYYGEDDLNFTLSLQVYYCYYQRVPLGLYYVFGKTDYDNAVDFGIINGMVVPKYHKTIIAGKPACTSSLDISITFSK